MNTCCTMYMYLWDHATPQSTDVSQLNSIHIISYLYIFFQELHRNSKSNSRVKNDPIHTTDMECAPFYEKIFQSLRISISLIELVHVDCYNICVWQPAQHSCGLVKAVFDWWRCHVTSRLYLAQLSNETQSAIELDWRSFDVVMI